jgi:6-phosphofructokinase 1
MASHIILPPDDEQQRREDEEADEDERPTRGGQDGAAAAKASLPFSAMCVRISRDSYPNLRTLRHGSAVSLADAAYVKISEGDFGYVLDDVPHLADYLPDVPVSTPVSPPHAPPPCSAAGFSSVIVSVRDGCCLRGAAMQF